MHHSKKIVIVCALLLLTLLYPFIGQAQSQGEMNRTSYEDFQVADAKLNQVYKQLTDKVDKQALEKLKASQCAWVVFRDAEADLQADLTARGGTMAPLERNVTRTELTEARTAELKATLTLIKEVGN